MANYKDSKLMVEGKLTTIKRGQIVTSYREIAERWGFVYRTVKRRCDALEADNVIVQEVSHRGTTITICNYEKYQEVPKGRGNTLSNTLSNTESNSEGSAEGNSESIHSEEVKEVKEVKNNSIPSSLRKKKAAIKYDQWDLGIATQLQAAILSRNPDANIPETKIPKWANELRLLRNKHDPKRIEQVLDWTFKDDFWSGTIQSVSGLKKHWNKITGRMNSNGEMSLDAIATKAAQLAENDIANPTIDEITF